MKLVYLILPAALILGAATLPEKGVKPRNVASRTMNLQERIVAVSMLPWRDPQPLLPRAGSALDEREAVLLEEIYQQLRDEYRDAEASQNQGIEFRRAEQRFQDKISNFVRDHPDSAWAPGLRIEMAKDEIRTGAYVAASGNLARVWEAVGQAAEEPSVGMAWVSANLLARTYALCGRFDALADLEAAVTNSPFKAIQGLHWARAKELQRFALENPEDSYKCGLFCLDLLCRATSPGKVHPAMILEQKSSPKGWTAAELVNLAASNGILVDAVLLSPESFDSIPVPSIVHLNSEHFVYVEQRVNGVLQVVDPIAETPSWMLPTDLAREASGCVLVAGGVSRPTSAVNLRQLTRVDASTFRGRCHGPQPNDRHDAGPCPNPALEGLQDCDDCPPEGTPAGGSDGSGLCPGCMVGMPYVALSEPFLNPWVTDRPFSYQSAFGPKVSLDLAYNPRQTPSRYDSTMFNTGPNFGRSLPYTHPGSIPGQPAYVDATAGWSSSVLSHAKYDAYGYSAEILLPGGRWADFEFPGGQSTSTVNYRHNTTAQKIFNGGGQIIGMRLWFRNGSSIEYTALKNGRYFMTARRDAMGRATTFSYDMNYTEARLTSFSAADGITFSVTMAGDGAIDSITSAVVSKTATFQRTSGQLSSITDAVGITSTMTGENNGSGLPVISSITTPYGTTYINAETLGSEVDRRLVIVHPDTTSDIYVLINDSSVMGSVFATAQVPTNTPLATLDITARNERNLFHWGRQVSSATVVPNVGIYVSYPPLAALTQSDINRAKIKHWLATSQYNYTHFDTLSLVQEPSPVADGSIEGAITWFDYAGKIISYERPSNGQVLPSVVARVSPDGSTWVTSFTRTIQGKPLVQSESWMEWNGSSWVQKIRSQSNSYSSDGIDLLEERDGSNQLIKKYGWDSSHRLTSLREYYQYTTDPNTGYYETLYGYDSSGRVTSETSPTGLATYWTYPTPPLNHSAGYYITINRSPIGGSESEFWQNGQLKSSVDTRGLIRQFTWDALNRLTRTTYPDSTYSETTYIRLSDGQKILDPVTVRDRMGYTRFYEYDSVRRKTKVTDERGKITLFAYCACGSPDTIADPVGNIIDHEYDFVGRLKKTQWKDSGGTVKAEKNYEYDIWGRTTLETDGVSNGNSRRYSYDNRGLRTVVEAQTGIGSGSSWARLSRNILDIEGRPTTVIDRNGVKITQTFDAMNRVLTRTHPAHVVGGSVTTESYGYSARGRTSWVDLANMTWTYAYDQLRRKTSETQPDTDGNPNNDTTSYTYNNAGDLLTLTDPRGKITTWAYDNHGRIISKTYPGDGFANLTYNYDANSRLSWRRSYANASSYRETTYGYDNAGNLTLVNYPSSPDLTYVYDDAGRLQSMTDATGTTTFTYTEWNGLKTEDGPWSGTTDRLTYSYSTGRRLTGVSVEQPTGTMAVTYSPDLAGRIAGVTSPAGTFVSTFVAPSLADYSTGASSTYAASLADIVSIPNSGLIDLDYDLRGRLKFTELRTTAGTSLNKHTYSYNTANRRTRHTRGNSGWTDYTYDAIGQLDTAMATLPSLAADSAERLDYGYDAGWNMASRQDNGISLAYSVNDRNQVTVEPNFNYSYDVNGNRIGSTTTTTAVQYGFDDENQLVSVTRGTGGRSEFMYDAKMRRRIAREYSWGSGTAVALIANGAITAPTRNNFSGWVGGMIQIGASPLVVTELGRWKLSGNSGSHVVKLVRVSDQQDVPGASVTVNMVAGTVGSFVYSALVTPVVLEANSSYFLVTQETNGGDFWYDWNQPATGSGGLTIISTVWSTGNGVYTPYGSGSTSYGPVGLKGAAGTWSLSSEIRYIYDGMRVIQERNGAGTPTVAYTRGPDLSSTLEGAGGIGGLLARSVWNGSAWATHTFYHSDGNGNVTALAEPSGGSIALSASYRYDPFGRIIGTPTGLAAANTQRFSSKEWHGSSGLYYYGYRFYDPQTQRWMSRDPAGEFKGINIYTFSGNDSIQSIDAFGEEEIEIGEGGIDLDKYESNLPLHEKRQLSRGCIGLTAVLQSRGCGKPQEYPEMDKNTKCFASKAEATAAGCPANKTPFLFVKQGEWKNGKRPKSSKGGRVPNDSISNADGRFNYAAFNQGKYYYMNHCFGVHCAPPTPDGLPRMPKVFASPNAPETDEHYPNEIWCITCKCK